MQKKEFDLIYKLDSGVQETYLAPRLLPSAAPAEANNWQRLGTLSFRYRYPFMPIGIINRLIVRLSGLLKEDEQGNDLVWREGAILSQNGCTALLKEDKTHEGLDVIDISVRGDERKELLGHIRQTLGAIHAGSFKGLDVEELVPCCCEICAELVEPSFFEVTKLKRYIESSRTVITCDNEKSVQDVSLVDLLEGVVERRQISSEPWSVGEHLKHDQSAFNRMEWKLDKLANMLQEARRVINIHGDVGALSDSGNIQQAEVHRETPANGKKPFLYRTGIVVGIVAALAAMVTGVWQAFFKSEQPKVTNQKQVEGAASGDSTASAATGGTARDDSTDDTAVKKH